MTANLDDLEKLKFDLARARQRAAATCPNTELWHVSRAGGQWGPITQQELIRLIASGELQADDFIWSPGMLAWSKVGSIPGLLTPPPVPSHLCQLSHLESTYTATRAKRETPIGQSHFKKKIRWWNPFQKLESESEATSAAKAGVVTAGLLGGGNALTATVLLLTGLAVSTPAMTGMFIGALIGAGVASLLGHRVYKKPALWASIILLIWLALEATVKVASGQLFAIVVYSIALITAFLSVRGCIILRRLSRRSAANS